MRAHSNWPWHLDEVFVKTNGEMHDLWRAVDHAGEMLARYVMKRRKSNVAFKFLRKTMTTFIIWLGTSRMPSFLFCAKRH